MKNKTINKSLIKKIPELSVPAGNLKILNYAIAYGADSVYVGGKSFNLRTLGQNFSIEKLKQATDIVHDKNKKIYLTLNAIISECELNDLINYLMQIKDIEFDAIIISDPGLLNLLKKFFPNTRIHISTQQSTSNHFAVNFWAELGVKRVNIARELSYEDIKKICSNSNIEIEVFVHGALCISYSGRCLLSKYLIGRDANKGQCAHACRWKYYLMEEKRPNLFLPVIQDKRGTYILNSRDLCLIKKLDLIVDAGVAALKVEGRMKTENYVSTVTWAYRKALDLIKDNKFDNQEKESLFKELEKTSHRAFTEGFMFLKNEFLDNKDNNKNNKNSLYCDYAQQLTENDNAGYIQNYKLLGSVEGYDKQFNGPIIKARNQVKIHSLINIIQPYKNALEFNLNNLIDFKTKNKIKIANTNDYIIIPDIGSIDSFSIIKVKQNNRI